MKPHITHQELMHALDYNPLTGIFLKTIKGGITKQAGHTQSRGYVRIHINGLYYYAHRLAWMYVNGAMPHCQIDHINHVKSDNRIANLRDVTASCNQRNSSLRTDNTSGHAGVYLVKADNRWRSRIWDMGDVVSLGSFATKADAIAARKAAEVKYGFHENHGNKL